MNNKGFTIIELLVSMAAFTAMLLIASVTTINIGRAYFKGVNSINTQDSINTALSTVTEQAEFTQGNITSQPYPTAQFGPALDKATIAAVCIGETRYSFIKDRRLSPALAVGHSTASQQIKHVLWQDTYHGASCEPADLTIDNPSNNPAGGSSGTELLNENSRLSDFSITNSLENLVDIHIGIIYGDNDLVEGAGTGNPLGCLGSVIGSEWCASSKLATQVSRRLTGN